PCLQPDCTRRGSISLGCTPAAGVATSASRRLRRASPCASVDLAPYGRRRELRAGLAPRPGRGHVPPPLASVRLVTSGHPSVLVAPHRGPASRLPRGAGPRGRTAGRRRCPRLSL